MYLGLSHQLSPAVTTCPDPPRPFLCPLSPHLLHMIAPLCLQDEPKRDSGWHQGQGLRGLVGLFSPCSTLNMLLNFLILKLLTSNISLIPVLVLTPPRVSVKLEGDSGGDRPYKANDMQRSYCQCYATANKFCTRCLAWRREKALQTIV